MTTPQSSQSARASEDARLRGKDELIRDLTEFVEKVKAIHDEFSAAHSPARFSSRFAKLIAQQGWPL
jgi:hypothetical protein